MDTKALQLTSRFALPPNSLGYCGRGTALKKFKKCILGKGCAGVTAEIEKFIVLNPYLETISKITGKDKFGYSVAEAYCFGNELLRKIKNNDYKKLLSDFEKQGVPKWLLNELKEDKPKHFMPTHLFQVLHVGVGRASGAVAYNMDSINNCMIRWGKVEKIGKKKLAVDLNSLEKSKGKYRLIQQKGTFPFRPDFVPGLKGGDHVAVHWKQVVKKLTKDEVKKLTFWTNEVLTSLY